MIGKCPLPSGLAVYLRPLCNRLFDGDGLDVFQSNCDAGNFLLFAKAEFMDFDGWGFAFSTKLRTDLLPLAILLPSKMPKATPPEERCHIRLYLLTLAHEGRLRGCVWVL